MKGKRHGDYLKRLPPESYRGQACVHWSFAMHDRKTGWLIPVFHYRFREILTHAMFRYAICCPIYCLMSDHLHLVWLGIADSSDQRIAVKFFRAQLNRDLAELGAQLQQQPYDHVLKEEERDRTAFEEIAEYIVRNPERRGLVERDGFAEYPFTGCLVPGYPDLKPFQNDYWDLFWRLYAQLQTDGLTRRLGEPS